MDTTVGLGIQCLGILLVTLLSFFMMCSVASLSSKYWTVAWTSLLIALSSLFVAFQVQGEARRVLYSAYFIGEYVFGLMLIAGCRHHARAERIGWKMLPVLIPFATIGVLLPRLSEDFNNLFIVQAALVSLLFAAALYSLWRTRTREAWSPGERVMAAGLLLLSLDFMQYVPVFGSHQGAWGLRVPEIYFRYTSIGDLILEILLGFGTIMVLMEGVRREVEAINRELTAARDRLEQIARLDPLTEALTRHAFDALSSDQGRGQTGCVAVIDVDNLKPINDNHGHAAGDNAIRAVAKAIRTVTRPDDLLFRWGGDEFLVLMFGITEILARDRLDALNSLLDGAVRNTAASITITVSYGLSAFNGMPELRQAIEQADEGMYRSKFVKRQKRSQPVLFNE